MWHIFGERTEKTRAPAHSKDLSPVRSARLDGCTLPAISCLPLTDNLSPHYALGPTQTLKRSPVVVSCVRLRPHGRHNAPADAPLRCSL